MDNFDDYYEYDNGDEIVVSLDYQEPNPSLFHSSRGHNRPSLPREYTPVRTSKQSLMARNSNPRNIHRLYDDAVESREDDTYERMVSERMLVSRVNVQDDRSYGRSIGRDDRSYGRNMDARPTSRQRPRSNARASSGASVSPSLARKKGQKSKMDLTRPDSDTSFELFGTLLVQHIEPKMKNGMYTLDGGDKAYLEAIIPESLRGPFVEAVRVRAQRLPMEESDDDTDLEAITRKCEELGLGQSEANNFLLGGGEKRAGGKIVIRVSSSCIIIFCIK